jgi:hypothetical protein
VVGAAVAIQYWFIDRTGAKPSAMFIKSVIAGVTYLIQQTIEVGLTEESIAEAKDCAKQLFQGAYLSVGNKKKKAK